MLKYSSVDALKESSQLSSHWMQKHRFSIHASSISIVYQHRSNNVLTPCKAPPIFSWLTSSHLSAFSLSIFNLFQPVSFLLWVSLSLSVYLLSVSVSHWLIQAWAWLSLHVHVDVTPQSACDCAAQWPAVGTLRGKPTLLYLPTAHTLFPVCLKSSRWFPIAPDCFS